MTNLKRIFVGVAVLAVMLSAVLVIPSGATVVYDSFDHPGCYCGKTFTSSYGGGLMDGSGGATHATAHVYHDCDGCYAYVSSKCWVYTSNYNNYTSRTYTASGSGYSSATADLNVYGANIGYNIRAVENYYMIRIRCEGDEFIEQEWSSDGNVPLSFRPPVVVE